MAEGIQVEVVYAEGDKQQLTVLTVPLGSTVAEVLAMPAIAAVLPPNAVAADRLGIFSRKVQLDTVVGEGERIEIYRPLMLDPKEARRRRASR